MREQVFGEEFFCPQATLLCGQVFRYRPFERGYLVFTKDKACYIYAEGGKVHILSEDEEYFYNYFDLSRDYAKIADFAANCGIPAVAAAAEYGKGIHILRQDAEETFFSFIISQNNRIPRIRGIIERIAESLGEEREFLGERYFTFPNAARLAQKDESFYAALGAGYRAKYIAQTAERIAKEGLSPLALLKGAKLRAKLAEYAGVGPKVADCIALFGFADTAAFPVDTWIEKAYREDMGGTLKKREEISAYFSEKFGEYGGFMQQYLFYYKRGRRE